MLVAHTSNGLHIISLATGKSISSLSLSKGKSYLDLDGDGIIDTIFNIENKYSNLDIDLLNKNRGIANDNELFKHCSVVVMSGLPPQSQLFNGSLCSYGSLNDPLIPIPKEIASTSNFIIASNDNTLMKQQNKQYNIITLINIGTITCYESNGNIKWQVRDGPTYDIDYSHASVIVFDYDANRVEEIGSHMTQQMHVLLIGDKMIQLRSQLTGELLTSFKLPNELISKPIIADFDNDGINDIIIITKDNILGYKLEVRESIQGMLILVVLLIIIALLTLIANIKWETIEKTYSNHSSNSLNSVPITTKVNWFNIVRSTDNLHAD